ncbi:MAG: glycosyltransferase family 2 protein [Bacteroidetes bacterium]|nr:glycosyltransferase family 2 protein [Bacteroidota bacterium]
MLFYITYTPGSVQYLSFFVHSLVSHSTYDYCLVNNGCSAEEAEMLRSLCSAYKSRLTYHEISTKMIPHSDVLNRLLHLCKDEYFCFIDSDIFAKSQLPDFEQIIKDYNGKAVFAALPIWVKAGENIMKPDYYEMVGTLNETHDGICLGNTYLAVYRTWFLKNVIEQYGVDFSEYVWGEIPEKAQNRLIQLNINKRLYDTGKVVNVLLNDNSGYTQNIETAALCHIGGFSFETANRNSFITVRQKIRSYLKGTPFNCFFLKRDIKAFERSFKPRYVSNDEYIMNYNQRFLHRNIIRKYFLQLFLSMRDNQSVPSLPLIKDKEILSKLKEATDDFIAVYQRYNSKSAITG